IALRFDLRTNFKAVFVILYRPVLTTAALSWTVPKNRTAHPDQSRIVRRHRAGLLLQGYDLLDDLFPARFVFAIRKKGKTERRNHPDFCINKFGIYLNRGFEFVEGGIQIALQLVRIDSVVEAVDRPSPLGETAPVADARRELLVFEKRLELIVALLHRSLIT